MKRCGRGSLDRTEWASVMGGATAEEEQEVVVSVNVLSYSV